MCVLGYNICVIQQVDLVSVSVLAVRSLHQLETLPSAKAKVFLSANKKNRKTTFSLSVVCFVFGLCRLPITFARCGFVAKLAYEYTITIEVLTA